MVKIRKINILDGIELKEATFRNKHFPIHFHDTYSIGIIKNGIENLNIGDKNLIAVPKSIVVINQNELHSNCFYNNDYWTYQTLNLNFDALTFLHKYQNHKPSKNLIFQNLIEDNFLYQLISSLHEKASSNWHEEISAISECLLLNYQVNKKEEKLHYLSWENIILEIKNFLGSRLNEKINIEIIAKKYNKTSFQLVRAFKSHTGLTPIAYLTLLRLNKSKDLLASGNSLVETAMECGFFDQSHFSNNFKKYFGVTPKQFCDNFSNL